MQSRIEFHFWAGKRLVSESEILDTISGQRMRFGRRAETSKRAFKLSTAKAVDG